MTDDPLVEAVQILTKLKERSQEKEEKRRREDMSDVSQQVRELVRSELVRLAEFLRKRYGLNIQEIRQFLREMLTFAV